MVIVNSDNSIEINRLEIDADTQKNICSTFAKAYSNLLVGKDKIKFDGKYKPENDEYLAIENFSVDEKIKKAIKNPAGVSAFIPNCEQRENINAVFVGEYKVKGSEEYYTIVFQKFKKDQYITTKRYNLFFDETTFISEKRFGISVSDSVDCIYSNSELQFLSYHFARQIFDLSEYYRIATDDEVDDFTQVKVIYIQDNVIFKSQADSWIRRKIASIVDSNVLQDYSATQIKSIAKKAGIEIEIKNKKVVMPTVKKDMKVVLSFLDEEVYKGPFSQGTFMANSKKVV